MKRLIDKAKDFVSGDDGATAIEYGLLAALVAVVIIGAITSIGTGLEKTFDSVTTKLKSGTA